MSERRVLGFAACASAMQQEAFVAVSGFDAGYGVGGEERP
jgi:hypothetical protein